MNNSHSHEQFTHIQVETLYQKGDIQTLLEYFLPEDKQAFFESYTAKNETYNPSDTEHASRFSNIIGPLMEQFVDPRDPSYSQLNRFFIKDPILGTVLHACFTQTIPLESLNLHTVNAYRLMASNIYSMIKKYNLIVPPGTIHSSIQHILYKQNLSQTEIETVGLIKIPHVEQAFQDMLQSNSTKNGAPTPGVSEENPES